MDDKLEKIRKEIDAVMDIPALLRDDDITVEIIKQLYGVSHSTALRIIKNLARKMDGYELIKVKPSPQTSPIYALRKLEIPNGSQEGKDST